MLLLQTDLRLLKEKSRRKQAILVRQEEELGARDGQLAAAQREALAAAAARDGLAADSEALRAEASELRAKLEESRSQLHSNEQMIRWLNQQVCCCCCCCCCFVQGVWRHSSIHVQQGHMVLHGCCLWGSGGLQQQMMRHSSLCEGGREALERVAACPHVLLPLPSPWLMLPVLSCHDSSPTSSLAALHHPPCDRAIRTTAQVTDAQLQGGGTASGSRFKFRPSQLTATSLGAAAVTPPLLRHSWAPSPPHGSGIAATTPSLVTAALPAASVAAARGGSYTPPFVAGAGAAVGAAAQLGAKLVAQAGAAAGALARFSPQGAGTPSSAEYAALPTPAVAVERAR